MAPVKTELLRQADREYREDDIAAAELTLMRAAHTKKLPTQEREQIFDRLAALAAGQGLFSSAAFWYQKVFQSKTSRLRVSDPELTDALRNYRILLSLARSDSAAVMPSVTAVAS